MKVWRGSLENPTDKTMMNVLISPALSFAKLVWNVLRDLPWPSIMSQSWQWVQKWMHRTDGMYEVLEYESLLELKDEHGRFAQFTKHEKVKYLQNNIIAYQDHAWGDGEILQDYKCTPGLVVDKYRPGQKTFLLISLRRVKKRGDVDDFNMEWGIRNGFVRKHELWETEVRHRTRRMEMKIIFPKHRPPRRVWVEEALQGKQFRLDASRLVTLPNGRFQLTWQTSKPQLNERYQIHWEW